MEYCFITCRFCTFMMVIEKIIQTIISISNYSMLCKLFNVVWPLSQSTLCSTLLYQLRKFIQLRFTKLRGCSLENDFANRNLYFLLQHLLFHQIKTKHCFKHQWDEWPSFVSSIDIWDKNHPKIAQTKLKNCI